MLPSENTDHSSCIWIIPDWRYWPIVSLSAFKTRLKFHILTLTAQLTSSSALLCHLVFLFPCHACRANGQAMRPEWKQKSEGRSGWLVWGAAWWPSSSSAHWLSTFYWFDWAVWVRGCWRRCLGTLHFLRSNTWGENH